MSHVLRIGVTDQIAYFRAFDTDGSGKADLVFDTTGLSLSVFRVGLASVSIASLSAKAADNTAHADGAIRQVSGNLYTVDLPDAATADQTPSVGVKGSYTAGVIEPVPHPIVNYNPALVAVGANTVVPPTVAAFEARTLPSADYFVVGDYTAPANADIAAILVDTDATIPGLIAGIRGADSDTLKTLSDQIDGIAGATFDTATDSLEAIRNRGDAAWTGGGGGGGSTTISDEDIQEIVAGVTAVAPRICDSSAGTFRLRAGDTWIQAFTVVTTGADKFILAVKNDAADADTAAVLLIDSTDGLERINGAVPSDAGDASIATGAATITATVASNITLMIVPGKYVVTVKKLDVGSDVTPISTASLTVFAPGVSEIST